MATLNSISPSPINSNNGVNLLFQNETYRFDGGFVKCGSLWMLQIHIFSQAERRSWDCVCFHHAECVKASVFIS